MARCGGVVSRVSLGIISLVVLVGAGVFGWSIHTRRLAEQQLADKERWCVEEGLRVAAAYAKTRSVATVERGMIFESLLNKAGLDSATSRQMTDAARPVFNFRQLKPGNKLTVLRTLDLSQVRGIIYRVDPDRELWVTRDGDQFQAKMHTTPSQLRVTAVAGVIDGSLFQGVMDAGERPELAVRLAEIFGWDLDFYTDPQPGDTFRLVLEKKEYSNGEPAQYGRILVAEYRNAGRPYQAVLFHDSDGHPGYYSGDGKSLQKAFLRSPLKFAAHISSHFSRSRFHPILKIYRPHLGTDYAAPTGTPVQAIAAGRVVSTGWNVGGGNAVHLIHANGYESYYMHLSRILVHQGQHVEQGQRIGLVGMTGLATGPHLDFRLRLRGAFVNFERLKLPPSFPVPPRDLPAFTAERDKWMAQMPSLETLKTAVAQRQPGEAGSGR